MIDPQFTQIFLTEDFRTIRLASTTNTARLEFYTKVFKLKRLHKFCADVDMFLKEYEIEQLGVHYKISVMSVADIMYRLRNLGIWPAYIQDLPLENCMNILHSTTLPQLQAEEAFCDIWECGFCWNKNSYKNKNE